MVGLSLVGTGFGKAAWSRVPGMREVVSAWCAPGLVWLLMWRGFREPWLSNTRDRLSPVHSEEISPARTAA